MKRILGVIAIVAASAILSASNVLGEEEILGNSDQKDECLLLAKNCADSVDTIHQRIERLTNEIAKGTDVYSGEELNILKNKLEDAERLLDDLLSS